MAASAYDEGISCSGNGKRELGIRPMMNGGRSMKDGADTIMEKEEAPIFKMSKH